MSKKSPVFNLAGENRILLKEKKIGQFSRRRLEKLLRAKNPIRCKLKKKMSIMYCKII